jgi:hypothetical protein
MSNTWKITNKTEGEIKISVALGGANNPGVILKAGEMVLSASRLTAPLDAQERRKMVEVDRDFDNSELNLPLGKPMKNIEDVIKDIQNYSGE